MRKRMRNGADPRNGYGDKMRNGTDLDKMRNGTDLDICVILMSFSPLFYVSVF